MSVEVLFEYNSCKADLRAKRKLYIRTGATREKKDRSPSSHVKCAI
jgi:hypothetical protein